MVRDLGGFPYGGRVPGLDVEIVSRRSPTTIRFGPSANVVHLKPDQKIMVLGGRARRPMAAPGPGEGGPPDVTMRSARELVAASPQNLLLHARDEKVLIRVRGVKDFDVHHVRSLVREAKRRGVDITLELD